VHAAALCAQCGLCGGRNVWHKNRKAMVSTVIVRISTSTHAPLQHPCTAASAKIDERPGDLDGAAGRSASSVSAVLKGFLDHCWHTLTADLPFVTCCMPILGHLHSLTSLPHMNYSSNMETRQRIAERERERESKRWREAKQRFGPGPGATWRGQQPFAPFALSPAQKLD